MNNLVTVSHLTKKYGHKTALSDLSLTLNRGRIIGLLGPNGCGKSTLIKCMNGLLVPNKGEILIEGSKPGIETKKKISYLPERSYCQSNMQVRELLSYFSDFYENFLLEKARAMLADLDIDEKSSLKSLSKGTKEKVQLILVMARDVSLYILDEPIAGVDPAARDYILKTILTDYSENASILMSTHLISDIEAILDDVIFMKEGQILLSTDTESIRAEHGKSVDAYFREVFAC